MGPPPHCRGKCTPAAAFGNTQDPSSPPTAALPAKGRCVCAQTLFTYVHASKMLCMGGQVCIYVGTGMNMCKYLKAAVVHVDTCVYRHVCT